MRGTYLRVEGNIPWSALYLHAGTVGDRAINDSMSNREYTGSKGACLSATDARQVPWCDVSSDCAGAQRYINAVIRS